MINYFVLKLICKQELFISKGALYYRLLLNIYKMSLVYVYGSGECD